MVPGVDPSLKPVLVVPACVVATDVPLRVNPEVAAIVAGISVGFTGCAIPPNVPAA